MSECDRHSRHIQCTDIDRTQCVDTDRTHSVDTDRAHSVDRGSVRTYREQTENIEGV